MTAHLMTRPPDARTASRYGLFGAALGFGAAAAVVCAVFVWTSAGQSVDRDLLPRAERGGGYEQTTGLVAPAKTVLESFGDTATLLTLVGAVLLTGIASGRARAGVAGVLVFLGSAGLARALKPMIERPDFGLLGSTTHNSFPSGHVAAAAGLLVGLLVAVPARMRGLVAVPGAAGVSVIAAATMVAGWHRLSDVVAAVLLAAALGCLAVAVLRPATEPYRVSDAANWLAAVLMLPLSLAPVVYAGVLAPGPAPLLIAMSVAGAVVTATTLVLVHVLGSAGARAEPARGRSAAAASGTRP
ncbi:phosphatase PAP2 family protein [Amycolatopsis antarctica]|nr:phosphatase PAP2 family protein [Amycolatopsis antarctica]